MDGHLGRLKRLLRLGKRVPRDMETYALIQSELLPNYARVYDKALALDESIHEISQVMKEVEFERTLTDQRIRDLEARFKDLLDKQAELYEEKLRSK